MQPADRRFGIVLERAACDGAGRERAGSVVGRLVQESRPEIAGDVNGQHRVQGDRRRGAKQEKGDASETEHAPPGQDQDRDEQQDQEDAGRGIDRGGQGGAESAAGEPAARGLALGATLSM